MPKQRPKPQARGLATGLQAARKASGLSSAAAAGKLGWSQATVSRSETGKRHTSPEEVAALLAVYGVTGLERDRLIAMARDRERTNWLETQSDDVIPAQATTLADYEAEATRIIAASLILIPGLLQTAAYTRAMMNSGGVAPDQIEPRVRLRTDRHQVLQRRTPPGLLAIMDEAVLHRRIGGRRVMSDQLRHLLRMTELPHVTLAIIPFDHGGHAGIDGAFVVVKFETGRPVVHLEHLRSSLFLDEPSDVRPYEDAIARMVAVALDPAQSTELIAEMALRYEKE